MTAISSPAASAPRIPWRAVGLVAVLLLALLIGAVLVAARSRACPPPFGPAANGLVAYDLGGDIYATDPITGAVTALVAGPTTDMRPVWSRNGTQFVFERMSEGTTSLGKLFVADADGRGLMAVTPTAMSNLADYAFSPDGRELLFTSGADGHAELWIAKTDGSGPRKLDVGTIDGVVGPAYAAPDGAEIVFVGAGPIEDGNGVYAVNVASGKVRTILEPEPGVGRDYLRLAPDGTRLAFSAATTKVPAPNSYRVHVVTMDGRTDLTLPMPEGATFEDAPAWSNDSTRLAVTRGYAEHNEKMELAAVPADGSGPGVESALGLTGCCDTSMAWAPDDTTILVRPLFSTDSPLPQLLMDPATGATSPAPWSGTSESTWQRKMR